MRDHPDERSGVRSTPDEPAVRLGTLQRRPVPLLFSTLYTQRATGTLSLGDPIGDTHLVHFEGGLPAKASLAVPSLRVGELLVRWDVITPATLTGALVHAAELELRLGECLVGCYGVAREVVERALRAQVVARCAKLAQLPAATSYAFFAGVDLLGEAGGGEPWPSEPLDAMLAVLRATRDPRASAAVLAHLGQTPIEAAPEACATFATAGEVEVLESLSERPFTHAALAACARDPRDAVNVVAALFLTGLVHVVDRADATVIAPARRTA